MGRAKDIEICRKCRFSREMWTLGYMLGDDTGVEDYDRCPADGGEHKWVRLAELQREGSRCG